MFKRLMQIGIVIALVVMVACIAIQFLGAMAKF
jgi:hypothetical protein